MGYESHSMTSEFQNGLYKPWGSTCAHLTTWLYLSKFKLILMTDRREESLLYMECIWDLTFGETWMWMTSIVPQRWERSDMFRLMFYKLNKFCGWFALKLKLLEIQGTRAKWASIPLKMSICSCKTCMNFYIATCISSCSWNPWVAVVCVVLDTQ